MSQNEEQAAESHSFVSFRRLAMLWRFLADGNESNMQAIAQGFVSSVMRAPTALTDFSIPLRQAAIVKMITNLEGFSTEKGEGEMFAGLSFSKRYFRKQAVCRNWNSFGPRHALHSSVFERKRA